MRESVIKMISGHRDFQAERIASAEALRKECVWCVLGGSKSSDWGGLRERESDKR